MVKGKQKQRPCSHIPGLAAYFDNLAVYFKTFWQPWENTIMLDNI